MMPIGAAVRAAAASEPPGPHSSPMSDLSHRPKLQQPFLLDDPERPVRRARMLRLLRAVAVAIAIAVSTGAAGYLAVMDWRRERAYERVLREDLARLAEIQRDQYERTGEYGDLDVLGPAFVPSQAVSIDVHAADSTWRAAARHERAARACWVEGGVERVGDVECG